MTSKEAGFLAKGVLPNKRKLEQFVEELKNSDLSGRQRRRKRVKFIAGNGTYLVTLYFRSADEVVFVHTFTVGPLQYWGNIFKITKEAS